LFESTEFETFMTDTILSAFIMTNMKSSALLVTDVKFSALFAVPILAEITMTMIFFL
jgi:hypothetical protein